jgi:ATP phosphoribosyltransferase regulatory subunit
MPAESAKSFEALEAQAAALLGVFRRAGYEQVAPAILQPADIFLDQIGEQLRARTYVFTDLDGEELCLRPDLTVPVCRLYLERHPEAGGPARYCYNGPAFRYQPRGVDAAHPREFRQAGIENFAASDPDAAEIEVILTAVEALRAAGLKRFALRFGDISLFFALLESLGLPERWRLKLRHYFWRPQTFHALLEQIAQGERPRGNKSVESLIDVLPTRLDQAEETVLRFLEEKNLPLSGTRSAAEITERLLDHAADLQAGPMPKRAAKLIDDYLRIEAAPLEAGERIAALAHAAGLDLDEALEAHDRRFHRLREEGIDLSSCRFATEFGRNLEYYTGVVFQIEVPGKDGAGQIAGGGRYDGLLAHVGTRTDVPAIGCAIHTERLLACVKDG